MAVASRHTTLSVAEKSYPTSEVSGSGLECQAAMAQERLRGATPRQSSGAVAKSARLWPHRSSREELPLPEARGGGQEEQSHFQGVVAARAQEGLEAMPKNAQTTAQLPSSHTLVK